MDLPIEIELRPHIGTLTSGRKVEHDQWIVLAKVGNYFGVRKGDDIKPKQIGFLHKSGSMLAPIEEWNKISTIDRQSVLSALSIKVGREITAAARLSVSQMEAMA